MEKKSGLSCFERFPRPGNSFSEQDVLLVSAGMVPGGLQRQKAPGCGSTGFPRLNASDCNRCNGAIFFQLGTQDPFAMTSQRHAKSGTATQRISWSMLSG